VSKKGEPWAIVEIADLDAGTEVLFFSATYANAHSRLIEDAVLLVDANVSIREGGTWYPGRHRHGSCRRK